MSRYEFRLAGYAEPPGVAVVEIEELNGARRIRRALAGFGMWFAAAIVCVFIPIAHFVLVPACLFGAFVMLFRRLSQGSLVVSAKGTCPDCGTEQDLDLLGPWTGRTELACRGCQRGLHLILTELQPTP